MTHSINARVYVRLSVLSLSVSLLATMLGACEDSSLGSTQESLDAELGDLSFTDAEDAMIFDSGDSIAFDSDDSIIFDMAELTDQEDEPDRGINFPSAPSGFPLFRFPVAEANLSRINPHLVFGVDHDEAEGQRTRCANYDGLPFPRCYDGHRGSDFILLGGFETMDNGSALIVSALGGVVVDAVDRYYDRCHADLATADISCDGEPIRANYVSIEHEGGWVTHYYHLKQHSLLVSVGDSVSCGQALALIGSSGYSSAPHLHFEVRDDLNRVWDPYAGSASQAFSLWVTQESSGDSASLPSTSCSSP